MSTTISKIIEDAQQLSPKERVHIADALIKSLQTPEAEIEKQWIDEVSKTLKKLEDKQRRSVYGI